MEQNSEEDFVTLLLSGYDRKPKKAAEEMRTSQTGDKNDREQ